MAITEQHTAFAGTDRFGDRAYLAWATVATAYAIAFLQRVSPQSVSLSFMQDFGGEKPVQAATLMGRKDLRAASIDGRPAGDPQRAVN